MRPFGPPYNPGRIDAMRGERASAFSERCRARGGWSGTVAIGHRDGHTLRMSLRVSLLRGQDAGTRWLVSVTDVGSLSSGATGGPVRESLLARAPIGIVVYDAQLRCVWVNDAMERHDGVPPTGASGAV